MSVVFEGHSGESDSVIVADSLVEEKTLDSERDAVKRHFGGGGSDHIQLPELVNKVHGAIGGRNRSVDGGRKGHADRLLVGGLNQLDHWSLEEADETSSEFRPNISVQVHLNILLRDHELNVNSLDGWECSSVKQLLGGEADSDLELEALKVDISVAFSLNEALLELEVATVESGGEVIGLKNDGIVGHIVVEIYKFVVLL